MKSITDALDPLKLLYRSIEVPFFVDRVICYPLRVFRAFPYFVEYHFVNGVRANPEAFCERAQIAITRTNLVFLSDRLYIVPSQFGVVLQAGSVEFPRFGGRLWA